MAVTLFGAAIFEQRSACACRAAKMSVMADRLKVVEAESIRQQRELMDALFAVWPNRKPRRWRSKPIEPRWLRRRRSNEPIPGWPMPPSSSPARRSKLATPTRPGFGAFHRGPNAAGTPRGCVPGGILCVAAGTWPGAVPDQKPIGSFGDFQPRSPSCRRPIRQVSFDDSPGEIWRPPTTTSDRSWSTTAKTRLPPSKLRKAFELYRELSGRQLNALVDSPAGYRKALSRFGRPGSPGPHPGNRCEVKGVRPAYPFPRRQGLTGGLLAPG